VLMGPYSWLLFRYVECMLIEGLLFMCLLCSWYLRLRLRIICPTHDNVHVLDVNL